MKPWTVGLLILGIAVVVGAVAYTHRAPAMTSLPDGTTIYDVRSADEFAINHVTSATSLPLGDLQHGTLPNVPKNSTIAIYGTSASTSSQAADILKRAGYSHVIDMQDLAGTANYGLSIVQ